MAIQTQPLDYTDDGVALRGLLTWDDRRAGKRPAVMVAHQWGGRDEFIDHRARKLAELGYAGFALDMYGKGRRGNNPEENARLMRPFMDDRKALARRMQAALAAVKQLEAVDLQRVAAIGYCFGGLCVLDLARSGAELRGVASLHGLLKPPGHVAGNRIRAKILVLHGADDPMAPMEDVVALRNELSAAGTDWQVHIYGNAKHAFAVPGANNPQLGLAHDANAERRSWTAILDFLQEVLA
ncbi:MAG: dienelactone hydrolase family protein [Gammaproteobacteria bacterium]|nr:dienelactone hydrolase family protein [Gammaproteobacteria bacterium]